MRVILSALLVAIPGIAIAQTATMPDDIVVSAQREQARKAVATYVANISRTTGGQLARFHQPVCVSMIGGLPAEHAAIVEQRIREDAIAAGAQVAKAPCRANLIVMIAASGSDLIKDMRKHRPDWLTGLSWTDVNALIAPTPARAWSIMSLRNETGEELSPPSAMGNRAMRTRDALSDTPVLRVRSSSIVSPSTRQNMEASFVVIDRPSIVGMSLRQIADYAAMRGLGHTRPPAPGGSVDTILSLLDGSGTPPRALTASDAAFLRTLYSSDGLGEAVNERNKIARRIIDGK